MNQRPKRTIFDLTEYFDLRVELRYDLPANNGGYLDPHDDPKYIAVNRNLPPCEQTFTIAHELAHYLLHHNRQRPRHLVWVPDLVDRHCQSPRVSRITGLLRRCTFKLFTIEWEADLYTLFLLFEIGAVDDLQAYVKRHPERTRLFALVSTLCLIKGTPRIIKALLLKLLGLFALR